jgi:hypothetical protein
MSDKNISKIKDLKERFAKLSELQGKRAALMKELEASSIYDLCTYDLQTMPGRKKHFFLFEISSKKMIASGTVSSIKKWINRRKLDINLVYNHEILSI